MKNTLKTLGFVLGMLTITISVNAQSNAKTKSTPASDVSSGYTYDFNKTNDLIIDRITNANASNADAQTFLNQPDFPAIPKGKIIDANFKEQLRVWMEKNPTLIINTLKSHKDIVTQY